MGFIDPQQDDSYNEKTREVQLGQDQIFTVTEAYKEGKLIGVYVSDNEHTLQGHRQSVVQTDFPLAADFLQREYGNHSDLKATVIVHHGWRSITSSADNKIFVDVPIGNSYTLTSALEELSNSLAVESSQEEYQAKTLGKVEQRQETDFYKGLTIGAAIPVSLAALVLIGKRMFGR